MLQVDPVMTGTWSIGRSLRAPIAHRTNLFLVPREVMSTPTENTVLWGDFSKIPHLIEFWPCNLADSGRSLFLPPVVCHGGCERQLEARYCPPMRSRRRIGGGGVLFRFLVWERFCFYRYLCVRIEEKTIVNTIHTTGRWPEISPVFFKKISGNVSPAKKIYFWR